MDWRTLYDFVDRTVIRAAERRQADVRQIEADVARERRRAEVERRLESRRRVMEAIVDRGVYWPRDW